MAGNRREEPRLNLNFLTSVRSELDASGKCLRADAFHVVRAGDVSASGINNGQMSRDTDSRKIGLCGYPLLDQVMITSN